MPADNPPPAAPATLKQKASAVSVFLATTALLYYSANRPLAESVDKPEAQLQLKAESGDALSLRPLVPADAGPPAPLLSVLGAENESIDVHFADGALDAATTAELRQNFGFDLPATRGAIAWTTAGKGNGRTRIDVSVKPARGAAAMPEVEIEHVGNRKNSGLRLKVRHAVAVVRFSVLLGGDPAGAGAASAAAEQNALTLAGSRTLQLPGALPITVLATEARPVTLIFPVGAPESGFYLGGSGAAELGIGKDEGILLRDIGVRRADGSYKWYACAAGKGALFFRPRALRPRDCAGAASTLRAHDLAVAPTQVALLVNGDAYLVKDGEVNTVDWLAQVERYKLPSALLGLLYAALAKWVWQVFARGRGAAS